MNRPTSAFWFLLLVVISIRSSAEEPISLAEIRGGAVELRCDVSTSVPRVTLRWNASYFPVTSLNLYRRLPGQGGWGAAIPLAAGATSYADHGAQAGALYEYRLVRQQSSGATPVAEGFLWAGVNLPMVDKRGRMILVVDETIAGPLAVELDRLIADYVGDGWDVVRTDVSRYATPVQVKDAIRGWYAVDPGVTKVALLVGHVPVPLSGQVCPDGHWEAPPLPHHRGAWPTDAYYGDMDGTWTDSSVNYAVANVNGTTNNNFPGDGKFDVSLLTGEFLPELTIGRIDLSNMAGVANGVGEVELLRRYLNRLHAFRHRQAPFAILGERVLIDDDTFGPSWNLPLAGHAWSGGVSLFGNAAVAAGDWVPGLQAQDHLVAWGFGPGSFTGAGGVAASTDFRDTRCRAVVNLLFGSFFGDWNTADNFLRAPLVGRSDAHGLVSLWSGVPPWQMFPLAAGGTISDVYQFTLRELNWPSGPYPPADASWLSPDQSHVAIMGDPVLRIAPPRPVSNLQANVSGAQVTLQWANPVGESNPLGSRIYRATSWSGPFERIGAQTAANATTFVDTVPSSGTWHYMVRAVRRHTSASASYDNPAQGVFTTATVETPSYATWSAGLSNAAETADPNGDGIPNLLAYAIGATSGMSPAVTLLPQTSGIHGIRVSYSDKADVDYQIQFSPNFSIWYTVARKPPAGAWALNAGSGYALQAQMTLGFDGGVVVGHAGSLVRGCWRLKAGR